MASSLYQRLLEREIYGSNNNTNVRGLYGSKKWIDDLDIVNELDGHTGCVNALSWSRNGRYLASGSDDHHLNIHAYNPDDSIKPFELATSIVTGHSANIFSVKFMPHTNDRTLVTVAGDAEVRIFDVEASSRSMINTSSGGTRDGVRYLSEGDTNAKVFKSHSDRVKRIVTESSPHLFLTCSEDGEVRQWDLRQPSSAYPRARGPRMIHRGAGDDNSSVPPPLISYKKWRIDLNTISCSPTQPHYIALGGTHLHCFLHDRRMLGRDRVFERGGSINSNGSSEREDEMLGEATRCVKKFAPNGQQKMKRNDSGHITACKISDANPNELIASWSGDWIYNFDILREPDSTDRSSKVSTANGKPSKNTRVQSSKDRKRKRTKEGSTISHEGTSRANPRSRTASQEDEPDNVAIHVRYRNGQSEAIPLRDEAEASRDSQLSQTQKQAAQFARTILRIRKLMFDLKRSGISTLNISQHRPAFTSTLGFASSVLDDMALTMREWGYPMDPDPLDVAFQQTLRKTRESTWRFVQASGTLARLLGGKLQTAGAGPDSHLLNAFDNITGPPNESKIDDRSELFGYEFIKAIVLWLSSGAGALIEGFSRNSRVRRDSSRHPLPEDASIEAIDEHLIPYLLSLAGDRPVPRLNVSPFEIDAHRQVFASEKEAVLSFARVIKRPFEDLGQAVIPLHPAQLPNDESPRAIDRTEAISEWGLVVARGVLCNASKNLDYKNVNQAFGGVGPTPREIRKEEKLLAARINDVDTEETENIVESASFLAQTTPGIASVSDSIEDNTTEHDPLLAVRRRSASVTEDSDEEAIPLSDIRHAATMVDDTAMEDPPSDEEGTDGLDDDSDEENEEEEDDDDDAAEDGDGAGARSFVYRSAMRDYGLRERVNLSVPCTTHTRHYQGHCNVKTIKDVNFYGLNDEYVVSGSDSGHVFIWDRKTSRLVNILEGDGEVVNVVQGHPYEPMLAVSGIDHTIKIFSPDARARRDAKRGVGIPRVDHSTFSSITLGRRTQRHRARRHQQQQDETDNQTNEQQAAPPEESSDGESGPEATANGLKSAKRRHLEYQITSQNDEDRRGGSGSEAYITRSMLAQIAARMHFAYHNRGGGGNGEGGHGDDDDDGGGPAIGFEGPGGQTVIVDDCMIM